MQIKEPLAPAAISIWQSYIINVRQRTILGGTANENFIKISVKKVLLKKNEEGYIFVLHVLDRTQSNINGVHAIENDLNKLQKEYVVQTNFTGMPVSILNLKEIKTLWEEQKESFQKKFKNEDGLEEIITETENLLSDTKKFTNTFIESELGTMLFPPLYDTLLK